MVSCSSRSNGGFWRRMFSAQLSRRSLDNLAQLPLESKFELAFAVPRSLDFVRHRLAPWLGVVAADWPATIHDIWTSNKS